MQTGADADFHDIGATQNQLLGHFAGHDVTRHDGQARMRLPQLLDESHERLRVAVRHVDADVLHRVAGLFHHALELVLVAACDSHGVENR